MKNIYLLYYQLKFIIFIKFINLIKKFQICKQIRSQNKKIMTNELKEQRHNLKQNKDQQSKARCLKNISIILDEQISLDETKCQQQCSVLKQIFRNRLREYYSQIQIYRNRTLSLANQQHFEELITNQHNKIAQLSKKINQLKQLYIYTIFLKKQAAQQVLSQKMQKYFEFMKRQQILGTQLKSYFSSSHINSLLFHQYLQVYNVNIFISDLIKVYFQKLINKILISQNDHRIFSIQRIEQLKLLQKDTIVFKQLYDINQKYQKMDTHISNQYISGLVMLLCERQKYSIQQNQNYQMNQIDQQQANKPQASKPQISKQSTKNHTKEQVFQGYNHIITHKFNHLNKLINKISFNGSPFFGDTDNQSVTIIVSQYQNNFTIIEKCLDFKKASQSLTVKKLCQQYKQFICSILSHVNPLSEQENLASFLQKNIEFNSFSQEPIELGQKPQQFKFLKQKIIKSQTLIVLNKTFSALNLLSYLMQQLNQKPGEINQYTFETIVDFITNQFRGRFVNIDGNCKNKNHKTNTNILIQMDDFGNWMIFSVNHKIVYPSALNGLMNLIKYILQVATELKHKSLFSQELMLQIISLKAQQISKNAQIIFNIYNLIKSKQMNCYSALKSYMKVLMKGFFKYQIQWIQNLDLSARQLKLLTDQVDQIDRMKSQNFHQNQQITKQLNKQYIDQKMRISSQIKQGRVNKYLTYYAQKSKKADFLSQIVYEVETNYEMLPVLQELIKCQKYHQSTFNLLDKPEFYQMVLYEIIQMRNHIKLDHFYTLPRLHQIFGFFTTKLSSFNQIIHQLSTCSTQRIMIQQILVFFRTQLKLKRLVFCGELYWLGYKNQDSRDKSFRQFVDDKAKNILLLTEQTLQYFLININQFVRKVNFFQQEIQRLKAFQIIYQKNLRSKIKIPNLQNYLKGLSNCQLKSIYHFICSHNPILDILKGQNKAQSIFNDIKMSIQLNGNVKYQDISRNLFMMNQKKRLSDCLFLLKAFGFELSYINCFKLFTVEKYQPSTLKNDSQLTIIINRQKSNIISHYQELLFEQRKTINYAIMLYQRLILIALVQILDEISQQNDKQIIQQLFKTLPFQLKILQETNKIKNIFNDQHIQDSYSDIYILLNIKKIITRLQIMIDQSHSERILQASQDRVIQMICLISKISIYGQKKIVQKIQNINQQIFDPNKQKKNTSKKIADELHRLNNKIIKYFLKKINLQQGQNKSRKLLQLKQSHTIQQIMKEIKQQLKKRIQKLTILSSQSYKTKQQLILFDQFSGYKIKQKANQQISRDKDVRKNDRKINKKAIFSPVRSPNLTQNDVMQNIHKRVAIQIIKQSIDLRTVISNLQLQDKKMKDQIAWETSKLQHNVINKINAFINQSNIDQQQSYINFKYTVNLQTIKGMQNVIKEQTQLAMKSSEQKIKKQYKAPQILHISDQTNIFLTNPQQKSQNQQDRLAEQNSRMLNTNIETMFNHMKKIRIFAAWKKIYRNMDLTKIQWANFNKNVTTILHNQQNMRKIQRINEKRGSCFKQNIMSSLLKEQNKILSEKIRATKMEHLSRTIQQYRLKYSGAQD